MWIIKNRKIFYILSVLLLGASIFSLFYWGLNYGIDFKGGSLLEISFSGKSPSSEEIKDVLSQSGFQDASVRESSRDENGSDYIIRLRAISPEERDSIINKISSSGEFSPSLKGFNVVGPVLGAEAAKKSLLAIAFVMICIVLFITFAFRKVSRPISSWIYGIVAIIALIHDVVIPVGAFSILGHAFGFEVDTLFVTALLVILGFSVHDTIVVFDRVRENLGHSSPKDSFEEIVGRSVTETFARSINTSLTTLLAILVLYVWGPESTHHFALALLIGITVGTYSSIFIGSPLLVTINKWKNKS